MEDEIPSICQPWYSLACSNGRKKKEKREWKERLEGKFHFSSNDRNRRLISFLRNLLAEDFLVVISIIWYIYINLKKKKQNKQNNLRGIFGTAYGKEGYRRYSSFSSVKIVRLR